jgi:hypothetical protein
MTDGREEGRAKWGEGTDRGKGQKGGTEGHKGGRTDERDRRGKQIGKGGKGREDERVKGERKGGAFPKDIYIYIDR